MRVPGFNAKAQRRKDAARYSRNQTLLDCGGNPAARELRRFGSSVRGSKAGEQDHGRGMFGRGMGGFLSGSFLCRSFPCQFRKGGESLWAGSRNTALSLRLCVRRNQL